jgi:hypothetical protein
MAHMTKATTRGGRNGRWWYRPVMALPNEMSGSREGHEQRVTLTVF